MAQADRLLSAADLEKMARSRPVGSVAQKVLGGRERARVAEKEAEKGSSSSSRCAIGAGRWMARRGGVVVQAPPLSWSAQWWGGRDYREECTVVRGGV